MQTLQLLIKRVSVIKSTILCASILSNKSVTEEATKCLFRTSLIRGNSLTYYHSFWRAMRCISAAYVVMRCLSVCPSVCHVRGSCQKE